MFMKRILTKTKPVRKMEDGSSSPITMMMCYIALSLGMFFLAFIIAKQNLFVLREELLNGMHIVLGKAMTSNHLYFESTLTEDQITEEVYHIITDSRDNKWQAQCQYLAGKITEGVIDQYYLDTDKVTPTKGATFILAGEDSSITIADPKSEESSDHIVYVYEPVYAITTTRVKTSTITDPADPDYGSPFEYVFKVRYNVSGWYTYKIYFTDHNVYASSSRSYDTQTPKLSNGDSATGATIEMALKVPYNELPIVIANTDHTGNYIAYVVSSTDITISDNDPRAVP